MNDLYSNLSESTISILISLTSLILVIIFQYLFPAIRDNKLMRHKLLQVYAPLFKELSSPKMEFLATFNRVKADQYPYIPKKLVHLVQQYENTPFYSTTSRHYREEINRFIRVQYSICQSNLRLNQTYVGFFLILKKSALCFLLTLPGTIAFFGLLSASHLLRHDIQPLNSALFFSSFFAVYFFIVLVLKGLRDRV